MKKRKGKKGADLVMVLKKLVGRHCRGYVPRCLEKWSVRMGTMGQTRFPNGVIMWFLVELYS